jgi:hypothetical protein
MWYVHHGGTPCTSTMWYVYVYVPFYTCTNWYHSSIVWKSTSGPKNGAHELASC